MPSIFFTSRPLRWLHGEIKAPPFSEAAQDEAGRLLRRVQNGEMLTEPQAKPIRQIGVDVYELRVRDKNVNWRIIYRADDDAVLIIEVFAKKTSEIPKQVIENCKKRLRGYDGQSEGESL